jgi:phospholipid transport system transporter-binding protein
MLFSDAAALRVAGAAALTPDVNEIDLAAITDADSAALAVLFSWLRDARKLNSSLRIANPPAGLLSLAALYGVDDFLPLA